MLEPQLVEGPRDDEVDEVLDGFGAVVEAGCEEEDRGSGLAQREHVAEMDRRQRRLARHEHEPALFLQRDGRGAVDEVLHRAGSDRPDRPHRAGADHVRVDLGRARGVGSAPVFGVVDAGGAVAVLEEPRKRLVAWQCGVTEELGRQHLDPGARSADPDLALGRRERLEQPRRVRRAGGARDPEEDVHSRDSGCYRRPLEASRKIASSRNRFTPSESNGGIGEPGCTHDGHFKCWIWNRMPRCRLPIAVRSGAFRLLLPEPAYV